MREVIEPRSSQVNTLDSAMDAQLSAQSPRRCQRDVPQRRAIYREGVLHLIVFTDLIVCEVALNIEEEVFDLLPKHRDIGCKPGPVECPLVFNLACRY